MGSSCHQHLCTSPLNPHHPRGDDLDTRLLRAMVVKGLLEGTTTSTVNLVNADLLAKNRGLKITEVNVRSSSAGNEVGAHVPYLL